MKKIIAFTGQVASGKGTAAAFFVEKHGAKVFRFSTMLRDILDRLYLPQSRENMQDISRIIREQFGEETLARVMARDVTNDPGNLIVIDGIRRSDDVAHLVALPEFVLVHIVADIKTRYERITHRGENSDDQQKTFDAFKHDHEQEAELKIANVARSAR